LTCRSCGTAIDDNLTICPECGAELFLRRRRLRAAENEAAQRYHESMKAEAGGRVKRAPSDGPARPSRQRPGRNASERPAASRPQAESQTTRRAGSMPNSEGKQEKKPENMPPTRMVRQHQYKAIVPQGNDSFNWMRLLAIAGVCVLLLTVTAYFFLVNTSPGQMLLASFGREASMEAYHAMGRRYMQNGSISRAVRTLEIAQSKDPDNLEVLIDLGKAYTGSNQEEKAVLAYTRAIQTYPAYPESYQMLIDIFLEQERNFEAIQLVEIALERTEDQRFETMLSRLLPEPPTVDKRGQRYNTEIDLVLMCVDEGATIYYTLVDEDPIEYGIKYEEPIHLTEKSVWRLRAVTEKDGMYSKETVQSYSIIKDQPDMPKTNLSRGSYKAGTTVRLRAGDDVEAMYYTVDGTRATVESKKYDDENPIVLAIGNTTIRAIAVNFEGKISNELNIAYEGTGNPKSSMSEKDTVDGLTLYKTTMPDFIAKYGQPQQEVPAGTDKVGTYTKLTYSFGYAIFLARTPESVPILQELYTRSSSFQGPRGMTVGSRMDDVIGVFRDHLGEADIDGNRVLYTRTTGQSGFLTNLGENKYKISYYHKLENKQHIELTYYVENGLVEHIEWLQY